MSASVHPIRSIRSTPAPPGVSLASLAEMLHRDGARTDGALIATVELGGGSVAIGTWPVPAEVTHPADVLIGYVAPPSWHAMGIVAAARSWSLDEGGETEPTESRVTYLAARSGEVVSLLSDGDGAPRRITEVPVGWVPDALARVLGRATPPPATSAAACVEAVWIDRIAVTILDRPGRVRSWEPLAALHPLAPEGPPLPGPLLALLCEQFEETSSWASLRRAWTGGRRLPRPPGGVVVEPSRWFDDGSFARWIQRDLVPADVLLPAVLDALPGDVGRHLVEALVTVAGPSDGATPPGPPAEP